MRKAERILQNREDARDVVHSLFVDLYAKRRTNQTLAYLYTAVTNRCLNHIRDASNRAQLVSRNDESLRGPVRTMLDDTVIGQDLLMKLVGKLDRKTAQVLIYRYWDDMTQDEIAELLHTSRKTIGKRIQAIRRCAHQLAQEARRLA